MPHNETVMPFQGTKSSSLIAQEIVKKTICSAADDKNFVKMTDILVSVMHHITQPTCCVTNDTHYNDVIMSPMASQIISIAIVYSTVYSVANQRKHHGLCVGNSPVTGEFPTQMASNAENASIWRHHGSRKVGRCTTTRTDSIPGWPLGVGDLEVSVGCRWCPHRQDTVITSGSHLRFPVLYTNTSFTYILVRCACPWNRRRVIT